MRRPRDSRGQNQGHVHHRVPEGDQRNEVVELIRSIHHQAEDDDQEIHAEHHLQRGVIWSVGPFNFDRGQLNILLTPKMTHVWKHSAKC